MPIVKQTPEILAAIVGTAGHVDHGKTSLVKLLSGCNTDRLPEEQARGMSIDLGFAPCLLEGRRLVGIVDVPGHKDFIRNMVAGASSIDVLMLVIAADDGVMPQTEEHMQILRLLRASQVMVALTKIDLVAPDMVELVRQDIELFLARHGFGGVPIIPVSNKTGEGIGEVRETMDRLVEQVRQRPLDRRAFRMNIERIFSVAGYGTVVTGIPTSGQIGIGEKVEIFPAGREGVVRTIQAYKHDATVARAACCCAINLREVGAETLHRGMTIAAPGVYQPTLEAIVTLENTSADLTLDRRTDVFFHSGTAAINASVKLLATAELGPGQSAAAHVMLAEPVVLAAGDRFIVRWLTPAVTFGGGVVLSARPQRLRRHADLAGRLSAADAAARGGDVLGAEVLAGPDILLPAAQAARFTQFPGGADQSQALALAAKEHLHDLGGGTYLVRSRAAQLAQRLSGMLERYHVENPLVWGMTPAHLCSELGLSPADLHGLLAILGPGFALRHERVSLATFQPAVSARLLALREQVLKLVTAAGVKGLAIGNIAQELNITDADIQKLAKLLRDDGTAVVLEGNVVLRSVFDDCRRRLLALFGHSAKVDLGQFRDAIGASRKIAVAMLDAFDAEGLTRRVADGRVLVKSSSAASAVSAHKSSE